MKCQAAVFGSHLAVWRVGELFSAQQLDQLEWRRYVYNASNLALAFDTALEGETSLPLSLRKVFWLFPPFIVFHSWPFTSDGKRKRVDVAGEIGGIP